MKSKENLGAVYIYIYIINLIKQKYFNIETRYIRFS